MDDDDSFVASTEAFLRSGGHAVSVTDSIEQAREAFTRADPPALLLLDLVLPDGNGFELLEVTYESRTKVVIVTGHPSLKDTLSDIVGPSISFLTKPFAPSELTDVIDAASRPAHIERHFGLIVGESESMHELYDKIARVATSHTTVLIHGESGTGKELIAEAIHRASGRRGRFVPFNRGGLPQDLASSELFGHERGSFSGADRRHAGVFERADHGTLFLDEIADVPQQMQVTLLRALETGTVRRLGGEDDIRLDLRVLAATNRNPTVAVRHGWLREDLYYRLRAFPISVPPLREHPADLPLLVTSFVEELNARYGTNKFIPAEGLRRFHDHDWPGNVRELKHAVHRAFIMSEGGAGRIDVPEHIGQLFEPPRAVWTGRAVAEVEKELILATLEHFEGDKRAAATTLGISLKTLYNRLRQYSGRTE